MAGRPGTGILTTKETRAFYGSQSTTWLQNMWAAFHMDKRAGADATFCDARLAIIEALLRERGADVHQT